MKHQITQMHSLMSDASLVTVRLSVLPSCSFLRQLASATFTASQYNAASEIKCNRCQLPLSTKMLLM